MLLRLPMMAMVWGGVEPPLQLPPRGWLLQAWEWAAPQRPEHHSAWPSRARALPGCWH